MFVIQGVTEMARPAIVRGTAVPENGTTAKASRAGPSASAGARVKTNRSARRGITSSLMRSFRTSAIGWSSPCGPTRLGPSRTCMNAMTFRSSSVM